MVERVHHEVSSPVDGAIDDARNAAQNLLHKRGGHLDDLGDAERERRSSRGPCVDNVAAAAGFATFARRQTSFRRISKQSGVALSIGISSAAR